MDDARVGRVIRILRQRRGWRLVDLAGRAGLSKSAISDIERGAVNRYTLAAARRVLAALNAGAELYVSWGGSGELDRLIDADHAALVERWADRHRRAGWEIWPEASYSVFGERGRIDLLAYHPASGVLEVAECKTAIWNVQDTIGRLDAKLRLAPGVARARQWDVRRVVAALVIADGRTARRRVAEFAHLFARYSTRGWAAKAFVADPRRPVAGILAFEGLPHSNHGHLRRAHVRRVRPIRPVGPDPVASDVPAVRVVGT